MYHIHTYVHKLTLVSYLATTMCIREPSSFPVKQPYFDEGYFFDLIYIQCTVTLNVPSTYNVI